MNVEFGLCRFGHMQLGRFAEHFDNHLVYVRCGRSILGQDEEVSAVNARVRIKIQLQTERKHEPQLATKVFNHIFHFANSFT